MFALIRYIAYLCKEKALILSDHNANQPQSLSQFSKCLNIPSLSSLIFLHYPSRAANHSLPCPRYDLTTKSMSHEYFWNAPCAMRPRLNTIINIIAIIFTTPHEVQSSPWLSISETCLNILMLMGCAIDWSPSMVKKPFYWEFKIDLGLRQSPNHPLITGRNQSRESHGL